MKRVIAVITLALVGCTAGGVRRVEFVRPASFDRDDVVVCVYRKTSGLLRCMTPEDAYLNLTDGRDGGQ